METGTRAFMANGVLLDEQHSFIHDLELFFRVLFWLYIDYTGPDKNRVMLRFNEWNFINTEGLV